MSISTPAEPSAALAPLVREVERIATAVERSTGCHHEREIEAMRREIDHLRTTIAYLRMTSPAHTIHIG